MTTTPDKFDNVVECLFSSDKRAWNYDEARYVKYHNRFSWEYSYYHSKDMPDMGQCFFVSCCGATAMLETNNDTKPVLNRGITIYAGKLGEEGGVTLQKDGEFVPATTEVVTEHVQTKQGILTIVTGVKCNPENYVARKDKEWR